VTLSIETCVEKLPCKLITVQDDSLKHISITCDGLIDLANESILAIAYKDVPLSWRRLLTDASLLKSLCTILFAFNEKNLEFSEQSLREICNNLDTAIVVSGSPGQNRRQLMDAILDLAQNELQGQYPVIGNENELTSKKRRRIANNSASQNLRFPVKSYKNAPMFMEFSNIIRDDSAAPFILNGIIDHWPAMNEHPWSSMPYLLSVAGARHVPVEFGSQYTAEDWSQRLMPFREFVETYIETPGGDISKVAYLAQHDLFHQIPRLEQDIVIPDYCYVSPPLTKYYERQPAEVITNAWFGPGGTISPLHHDPYHNLLAQVVGSKYIRLYSPLQTPKLYPHSGMMSNTSQVQLEAVDDVRYPEFKHAEYLECVLTAGQVLYIPVSFEFTQYGQST
jgi:lysine-specific demethylase 8